MINNKLKIYTLAPLFLVLIIDAMGIGLVLPLLGPLFISRTSGIVSVTMSIGMRNLLYGITLAIFCVFMFFGAPFLGDLSDHIGRKKVLLICLYGTAIGLAISALGVHINSLFLLIAGRAVAGFMCGSQALAQAAIVDISTEDDKATNLALIAFASCFGFVLGPIMAGLLSDENLWSGFGFATPFWAAGALALVNGTCLIFTFKETFFPKAIQRLKLTKGVEVFISAFTNKTIRKLAAIFLIAEMGWALYFQFLPLYLIAGFNYSTAQIGHIMAWMGTVFAISLLFIMRLIVKVFKIEQIAYFSMGLTAIGILLALFKTETVLWLSIIPTALGAALFYVGFVTLFSNAVDEDSQGWVMGIFAAIVAVSWSLSAVLSGLLGVFGLAIPFITAAAFLFLGDTRSFTT